MHWLNLVVVHSLYCMINSKRCIKTTPAKNRMHLLHNSAWRVYYCIAEECVCFNGRIYSTSKLKWLQRKNTIPNMQKLVDLCRKLIYSEVRGNFLNSFSPTAQNDSADFDVDEWWWFVYQRNAGYFQFQCSRKSAKNRYITYAKG